MQMTVKRTGLVIVSGVVAALLLAGVAFLSAIPREPIFYAEPVQVGEPVRVGDLVEMEDCVSDLDPFLLDAECMTRNHERAVAALSEPAALAPDVSLLRRPVELVQKERHHFSGELMTGDDTDARVLASVSHYFRSGQAGSDLENSGLDSETVGALIRDEMGAVVSLRLLDDGLAPGLDRFAVSFRTAAGNVVVLLINEDGTSPEWGEMVVAAPSTT